MKLSDPTLLKSLAYVDGAFVTADHGGVGKKHGQATMAEIEIPWIIAGPGIAAGQEITAPVNTFDTAATLAHILGVKPPECWIGKPVLSAFRSQQHSADKVQAAAASSGH